MGSEYDSSHMEMNVAQYTETELASGILGLTDVLLNGLSYSNLYKNL